MPKFRVKYTDAFKEKAIRMITEDGRPLTSAAADLGVPNSVLSKWVKKSREASQSAARDERASEMRRLAMRIERLEESLEVLRKIVREELLLKVETEFPGRGRGAMRPFGKSL